MIIQFILEEETQMANKGTKRLPVLLGIREPQVKQ